MNDLAIIIVNYNVKNLLRKCLQTIEASEGDFGYQVIVVDNNSPDDSVAMVKTEFPSVSLIANKDNPGYSAANNQGMTDLGVYSDTPPRYTLLLNPDTELPPTALQDTITFMDQNPSIGVMGPKLLLPSGELDAACRRSFPTPEVSFYRMTGLGRLFPRSPRFGKYNLTYLDIDETADVDSVVGAYMLVRTEAIQQVGGLDEQFWMYGEDLDWAKRIKDAGWRIIYNPQVTALHVKRASSSQNKKKTDLEFYRAMLIFYQKHYRQETPFWLHWLILLGVGVKGGRSVWSDIRAGKNILKGSAAADPSPA